jgi:hypothetical protein
MRLGGPLQAGDRNKKTGGRVEARGTEDDGKGSGCGEKIGAGSRARPGWAGQDGTGGQIDGGPGNRRTRRRDVNRDRGGCRGGGGVAGGREARWRRSLTQRSTIQRSLSRCEAAGDEHLGRARVGEEPVPFLHGTVEGLDVWKFRWETTREARE